MKRANAQFMILTEKAGWRIETNIVFTPSFNHLTKLLICIIIKYRSSLPPTSTGSQGVSYRCDHLFLFLYFSSWLCNRMCGGNQCYSNKQTGGRYKFPNTHYRRLRRLISHSLEHTLNYIPVPYYDLLTNPCWEKWVQTSPWNSMDLHLPTHGYPWNLIFWRFVKFHGYPCPYCWNSMSRQMKIHGIPDKASWKSMELQPFMICGIPWNSGFRYFVEIHGFSHGLSGIPWIKYLEKPTTLR